MGFFGEDEYQKPKSLPLASTQYLKQRANSTETTLQILNNTNFIEEIYQLHLVLKNGSNVIENNVLQHDSTTATATTITITTSTSSQQNIQFQRNEQLAGSTLTSLQLFVVFSVREKGQIEQLIGLLDFCPNLISLHLTIYSIHNISSFTNRLSNLKQLKNLFLNLVRICGDELVELCSSLYKSKSITKLSFSASSIEYPIRLNSNSIFDLNQMSFSPDNLEECTKKSSLSLKEISLQYFYISNQSHFNEQLSLLNYFPNLEQLRIQIKGQIDMSFFSDKLSTLQKLRSLELILNGIGQEASKNLAKGLLKIKSLSQFKLQISIGLVIDLTSFHRILNSTKNRLNSIIVEGSCLQEDKTRIKNSIRHFHRLVKAQHHIQQHYENDFDFEDDLDYGVGFFD